MNEGGLPEAGFRTRGRVAGIALALTLAGCVLAPPSTRAQAVRTQTLRLDTGWNAVYLEVDPLVPQPAELFAEQPVDIVAAYDVPLGTAQFVDNPTTDMLGVYGWAVWYSPRRPDAFLTRLYRLNGAKPYLVHATTNAVLDVAGRIPPVQVQWRPDAFNLIGFPVRDPGGPTFAQFFGPSAAHNHNRIYRMVGGVWRQVLDPAATAMRSGEAFWIYCDGPSDYAGPLHVAAPSFLGLTLSPQGGGTLSFRNRASHPIAFSVEHVAAGNAPIPFVATVRTVDEAAGGFRTVSVPLGAGPWVQPFPALDGGQALALPLDLRLADLPAGVQHSLLRVSTDLGTETYVAVTAWRDDLPAGGE